jgi:hypothetical protein
VEASDGWRVGAQGGEFRPEVALGIRRAWDAALRSVPSSRQGKLTLVSAPAPHFPGAGVFGTRCYRRRCCAYTRARDLARRASERVDLVDRLGCAPWRADKTPGGRQHRRRGVTTQRPNSRSLSRELGGPSFPCS